MYIYICPIYPFASLRELLTNMCGTCMCVFERTKKYVMYDDDGTKIVDYLYMCGVRVCIGQRKPRSVP